MKATTAIKKTLLAMLLGPIMTAVFSSQMVQAEDKQTFRYSNTIKVKSFSDSLKVRGFQITKGVYLGHAKVAGKYGVGLVVNRDKFSWGLNNRGISFTKRF